MTTTDRAFDVVTQSRLSPTEHLICRLFLEEAIEPVRAATYLLARLNEDSPQHLEFKLLEFLQDWRQLTTRLANIDLVPRRFDALVRLRDGPNGIIAPWAPRKLVLEMEPVYIIPPSLLDGLDALKQGRLSAMLEAFLSPALISQLEMISAEDHNGGITFLQNLWLLTAGMHRAFRAGDIYVRTPEDILDSLSEGTREHMRASKLRYYTLCESPHSTPSDLRFADGTSMGSAQPFKVPKEDPSISKLPHPVLFDIHRRLAKSLHQFPVRDQAAKGWPLPERSFLDILDSFPGSYIRRTFHHVWTRFVPVKIRLWFYEQLFRVGTWLFKLEGVPYVQRVPFGLVIKKKIGSSRNEANALEMVENYTTIPAPRLVDYGEHGTLNYLVMTHIRGRRLRSVIHLMSYDERDRLVGDLTDYVAQLRQIPNTTSYQFCDTLGGRFRDHRVPGGEAGPFRTEHDFNNHLTSHLERTPADVLGEKLVNREHRSYFTHSDFHPTNLLLENGRLSGIIDWECAAYKPEYWEFTKSMYTISHHKDLTLLFRRVFGQRWEPELAAERALWWLTPIP